MAKEKDKLSIYILLCFILFFIFAIRKSMSQRLQERTLLNSYKITMGSIIDCGVGKTADFGSYSFVLNDKVFTTTLKVDKFCFKPNETSCTKLKQYQFPIAYHTNDPDLSTMLLSKNDFRKYKMVRADSLSGIFERYFDCR